MLHGVRASLFRHRLAARRLHPRVLEAQRVTRANSDISDNPVGILAHYRRFRSRPSTAGSCALPSPTCRPRHAPFRRAEAAARPRGFAGLCTKAATGGRDGGRGPWRGARAAPWLRRAVYRGSREYRGPDRCSQSSARCARLRVPGAPWRKWIRRPSQHPWRLRK